MGESKGGKRTDADRQRRIRRAAIVGGVFGALAAVPVGLESFRLGMVWWAAVPLAVLAGAFLGWRGARVGRVEGVRDTSLKSGESLFGAYRVQPAPEGSRSTLWRRNTPYELRSTNQGLQLWKDDEQMWDHPWRSVRLTADGKLLLVHSGDRLVERLWVERRSLGGIDELMMAAKRSGARARAA
ncbi:hypothetical protein [Streptomyces sp. ODS05-4]|uniref:hypothetical protein n=1 Tax=Streptomyces sp. ODS05-4 TaxID=2944939 RepID=UPI00210AB560|nr:hypothetical protein [Streptomyces sp. ODS05-4]